MTSTAGRSAKLSPLQFQTLLTVRRSQMLGLYIATVERLEKINQPIEFAAEIEGVADSSRSKTREAMSL